MVKIIMHGCNGHMGQVITGLVKEDANAEIIAGIDMNDNGQNDYPVFKSLAECDVPADVVVDFSSYKAADALLDACKEKKLPLVLCTTGLTEDQLKKVQETSKEIPVLRSANMSLGVSPRSPYQSLLRQALLQLPVPVSSAYSKAWQNAMFRQT